MAATNVPTYTSTTTTSTSQQVTTAAPPDAGSDLDTIIEFFVGDAAGGVVALTRHDGELTTSAYGDANADGEPITRETPFRVGSISKPFVATMILQLVDEGKVDLDEPLGAYLPDTPVGADVTIRELLSHQSGLPNYTSNPAFFLDVAADFTHTFEPEEILSYVSKTEAAPTGVFEYSNTNYILLGMLLGHIDGITLNESLQERVAGPLGLETTAFVGHGVAEPVGLVSFWSFGLNAGLTNVEYESVASGAWAAGALVSTVDDLATFLTSLFDGDLISVESLAEMTDTGISGYGLGLFAAQFGDGDPGYAHNGSIPGFSATMGISPGSGDLIVILANNDIMIADQFAPQIIQAW